MPDILYENSHEEYEFTSGSRTAVIFVHGILGSPSQFRFLAESLHQQGFDCRAILLPGHGGTASAFARASAKEWQACVNKAVGEAAEKYGQVFMVGHSMGSLLCLNQSAGMVAGMILINTPLVFKISFKQLAMSWRILFSGPEKDDAFLSASREAYSIMGGRMIDYPRWVRQFTNLIVLARRTKKMLGAVKGNVLLVQSGKDESVHAKSAALLKAGLVNASMQTLELHESYHDYFTGADRQKLTDAVASFICGRRRDI